MKRIPLPKTIKAKLISAFLVIAVIPLLAAGIYLAHYSSRTLEGSILDKLEYEASMHAYEIEDLLGDVQRDLLVLSRSDPLKELLKLKGPGSSGGYKPSRERLEEEFLFLLRVQPSYCRIWYVDERGYEVAGAGYDRQGRSVASAAGLQYKWRAIDFMNYSEGRIYTTPAVDPDAGGDGSECLNNSVVRFATPVFDHAGRRRGVVMVDIFTDRVIRDLPSGHLTDEVGLFMVNEGGEYIAKLDASKGEDRAIIYDRTEGMDSDYTKEVVTSILSGKPGVIHTEDETISYSPVSLSATMPGSFWVVAMSFPKRVVWSSSLRLELVFVIVGGFAVISACILGVWMTKRFARPILDLYNGVKRISQGGVDHDLAVHTGDEMEDLIERFNYMKARLEASMEDIRERKRVCEERNRMIEGDLEAARAVQRSLLPNPLPDIPSLRLTARYLPMNKIGGDFYDVVDRGDSCGLFIADVSGHGAPAALFTALLKVYFRLSFEKAEDPEWVLRMLHSALMRDLSEETFITAFCSVYYPQTGILIFSGAGHPGAILYKGGEKMCTVLKANAMPICLANWGAFEKREAYLDVGDRLFLYTDGLFEARGEGGKHIGSARLLEYIESHCDGHTLDEVVDRLVDRGRGGFLDGADVTDDITVVVAERIA